MEQMSFKSRVKVDGVTDDGESEVRHCDEVICA